MRFLRSVGPLKYLWRLAESYVALLSAYCASYPMDRSFPTTVRSTVQGLSANQIAGALISMMARSMTPPIKSRIH
jgi:hypothetical protein